MLSLRPPKMLTGLKCVTLIAGKPESNLVNYIWPVENLSKKLLIRSS